MNVTRDSKDALAERLRPLEQRLARLEALVRRAQRPVAKIDSDSPVLPSMDDFNFSQDELRGADPASGAQAWTAPFRFPSGATRGLTWDSGSLGDQFVNVSLGFLDETGQLLFFMDAVDDADARSTSACRFVKTQHRFYYRHDSRSGPVRITATFDIRKARIHDRIQEVDGSDRGVELVDCQNLRVAAYGQSPSGDYWHHIGKAVDVVHELAWDTAAGSALESPYDHDLGGVSREIVMVSDGALAAGQLCKFYVGIWGGLSLRTTGAGYATFNEFDVRLNRVRAEIF
ncbi:MAG: hypothetical protein AAF772_17845 [Acidobacteriota bacterium]